MTETTFTHHEPCPRCGSRNNLGVYSDGHKWCFGCGYYVQGHDSIHAVREALHQESTGSKDGSIDTTDWVYVIPDKASKWLTKYGITPGEVIHFGLAWNRKTESLVLPIRNGDRVVLAQERYFGLEPGRPKYITYGQKNKDFLFVQNVNSPNKLIFTEDYISAIKVGRFINASPVLGATLSGNAIKWASGHFKHVRVWYDRDKAVESVSQAARLSQYVWDSRSIITELDPKEYSPQEILKHLREAGV